MSNTEFTPGPWVYLPAEAGIGYIRIRGTVLGERFKIANVIIPTFDGVSLIDKNESVKNAALIAAAPDLYDALEKMLAISCGVEQGSSVYEFAVAALTKARGE